MLGHVDITVGLAGGRQLYHWFASNRYYVLECEVSPNNIVHHNFPHDIFLTNSKAWRCPRSELPPGMVVSFVMNKTRTGVIISTLGNGLQSNSQTLSRAPLLTESDSDTAWIITLTISRGMQLLIYAQLQWWFIYSISKRGPSTILICIPGTFCDCYALSIPLPWCRTLWLPKWRMLIVKGLVESPFNSRVNFDDKNKTLKYWNTESKLIRFWYSILCLPFNVLPLFEVMF